MLQDIGTIDYPSWFGFNWESSTAVVWAEVRLCQERRLSRVHWSKLWRLSSSETIILSVRSNRASSESETRSKIRSICREDSENNVRPSGWHSDWRTRDGCSNQLTAEIRETSTKTVPFIPNCLQNIGPKWVSMNLAGLYWRIQGNPHQATKCLLGAFLDKVLVSNATLLEKKPNFQPEESFISIVQLTQVMLKTTRMVNDAHGFLMQQLNLLGYQEPLFHFVQGRMKLLLHDVDKAIQHLKEAMDQDPENAVIEEDLLKIACSGKSTKPAISSQFPTVCCSMGTQNAVCIRPNKNSEEQCYVVEPSHVPNAPPELVYHRCNGFYDGFSKRTQPFASIVSPFLLVFNAVNPRNDVPNWVNQVDGIQTVESNEMPLDYGGSDNFFTERPAEWWDGAQNEMKYLIRKKDEEQMDEWEESCESSLAAIPEVTQSSEYILNFTTFQKPLSFLWIKEKVLMMQYDAKLPDHLPKPSIHQIRRGVAVFPPPRIATMSCNGVAKLEVLFENAPSTWVSLTAKGEDIEKYVDLRGPMPAIASLLPVCPGMDKYKNSPILGLDHIPAFALSDQFLFYKSEKALSEALKSLGNERDTIEHVAARLHAAMLHSNASESHLQLHPFLTSTF